MYFASNDKKANTLIDNADKLGTGLSDVSSIKFYELIYYLYKMELSDKHQLRALYKYLYNATKSEKSKNPEWHEFLKIMDALYDSYIRH